MWWEDVVGLDWGFTLSLAVFSSFPREQVGSSLVSGRSQMLLQDP